jgi:PAS domain S-box-containing protein
MQWHFTPYVLPVVAAAGISAALALIPWHRRSAPGAPAFCLLMLVVAEWSLAYALELVSPDLPSTLFWDNVSWLGSVCAPTLWLVFALQYTGRVKWLSRYTVAILVIEPLVTLLLAWTTQSHGLVERNIRLDTSDSFSGLEVTYGSWYWINIAYSYLLLFLGTSLIGVFIQRLIRSAHLYLRQASALLIAVVAPWVGNALTIFGWNPLPHLDLTPFAFTITGLAFGWNLFRFRLLDIVPVAREVVIESMDDAVIVVDGQHRIVDLNRVAQRLAGRTASEAVGQPLTQVFSAWPELVERSLNVTEAHAEVVLGEGEALRYFDLHISPLCRRNGQLAVTACLIVLNDITEHKQAERHCEKARNASATFLRKPRLVWLSLVWTGHCYK